MSAPISTPNLTPYNPDLTTPLTRDSVLAAHELIKPYIRLTPTRHSTTLSHLASLPTPPPLPIPSPLPPLPSTSSPQDDFNIPNPSSSLPRIRLYLKLEPLQKTGSFKLRGATHSLARLSSHYSIPTLCSLGVATHSSGNHAAALALAASRLGVPATIVMPSISTPSKIAATRKYGGEVVFSGMTAQEREEVLQGVVGQKGSIVVPPYDWADTIVGQGTAALELMDQVMEIEGGTKGLDAIIAPVGGGGLLAGCCLAAKGTGVVVFGAEPKGADDCKRGLERGERVETVEARTIADGLRTPVGVRNWRVIKEEVGGVFTVSEEEIREATKLVWERTKVVVEPSAVVGVAVAVWGGEWREEVGRRWAGREEVKVGIVVTGGNTTVEKIVEIFGKE